MNISHSLFERFPERFNWEKISYLDNLTEEFIERNLDRFPPKIILLLFF